MSTWQSAAHEGCAFDAVTICENASMKILILLIALLSGALMGSVCAAAVPAPPVLVPWLASNGHFGYDTLDGKPVIAPQYTDAGPFVAGFAVVSKAGRYGMIDAKGAVVVPLRYAVAELFSVGRAGFALLVTKREYNAPWRFWQWRWMPEFNLLGGGSGGPTVVTKVPRAVWSVEFLPSRKSLFSRNDLDETSDMGTHQYWKKGWVPDRSLPRDLRMAVYDKLIQVDDKVWRLTARGRLVRLPQRVEDITYNGQLLVVDGQRYRLDDETGKPLGDRVFTRVAKASFTTPEGAFDLSQASGMGPAYPRIPSPIYRDQRGNYYLYPDFSKPLPRRVDDYHGTTGTLKADLVLNEAVTVWDVPKSQYFAVMSTAASDTRRLFLLDKDGHWNTQVPLYTDPSSMVSGGRITFGGKANRGVLDRQL